MRLRIGFQVWAQYTTWEELMAAGRTIDELGFDGLWSNDHFLPFTDQSTGSVENLEGSIFDGWTVLAGWAAATSRVRLGCLVSGVGYRNPALLVKMATGLDHMSGGRMSLGIGAGWFEREHRTFGFPFLPVADRLDRLEDAAIICRGLLDRQTVTHAGRWYSADGARNEPPPVQARLPLVIGGSGEKRTLAIVARYADAWNADGDDVAALRHKCKVLDEHCRRAGRPPRAVRRTAGQGPAMIRTSRDEAVPALAELLQRNGVPWNDALAVAFASPRVGTVEDVVGALAQVVDAGIDEVMIDLPMPLDRETVESLAGPVRERLAALVA